MARGKHRFMTPAELEATKTITNLVLKTLHNILLGGKPDELMDELHEDLHGEKQKPYPDKIPEDPLPDHEPDGYWSG